MTHIPNAVRLTVVPVVGQKPAVRNGRVHVIQCNGCGTESQNQAETAYETYVPYDWLDLQDGGHLCPGCRDPEALAKEQVARAKWIDDGLTVAQVRAKLNRMHAKEASGRIPSVPESSG